MTLVLLQGCAESNQQSTRQEPDVGIESELQIAGAQSNPVANTSSPKVAEWQGNYGMSAPEGTPTNCPQVPGDYDGDGDVDGRDFLAIQRGQTPAPRICLGNRRSGPVLNLNALSCSQVNTAANSLSFAPKSMTSGFLCPYDVYNFRSGWKASRNGYLNTRPASTANNEIHIVSFLDRPQANNQYGQITMEPTPNPVTLVLITYKRRDWHIDLKPGHKLRDVITIGPTPSIVKWKHDLPGTFELIDLPSEISITHVPSSNLCTTTHDWRQETGTQASSEFKRMITKIRSLLGGSETTFRGCVSGNGVTIGSAFETVDATLATKTMQVVPALPARVDVGVTARGILAKYGTAPHVQYALEGEGNIFNTDKNVKIFAANGDLYDALYTGHIAGVTLAANYQAFNESGATSTLDALVGKHVTIQGDFTFDRSAPIDAMFRATQFRAFLKGDESNCENDQLGMKTRKKGCTDPSTQLVWHRIPKGWADLPTTSLATTNPPGTVTFPNLPDGFYGDFFCDGLNNKYDENKWRLPTNAEVLGLYSRYPKANSIIFGNSFGRDRTGNNPVVIGIPNGTQRLDPTRFWTSEFYTEDKKGTLYDISNNRLFTIQSPRCVVVCQGGGSCGAGNTGGAAALNVCTFNPEDHANLAVLVITSTTFKPRTSFVCVRDP